MNFDDLIEKFSSDGTPATSANAPSVRVIQMKINNGEFYFHDKLIPVNYFIKKVNFESNRKGNSETFITKFSFLSGIGTGDVKGDFIVNLKNNDYQLATVIHQFDLQILEQYIKDLMNYGSISANLDANITAKGNFDSKENITISGMAALNDFHLGKSPQEDYASFDKLAIVINKMSPKNRQYLFDSVILSRPYLKYEQYDYLDNLQMMFGKEVSNIANATTDNAKFNLVIEIARYAKVLAKNFFKSYYEVNRLAIDNANLQFTDYAISEKFSVNLTPLYISADSITKNHNRVKVLSKSAIKPYGNVNLALSINPKDSSDFDMQYHLQKLPASMFNPYTISYSSFPLDRGTIELNGKWRVRNGTIRSDNHLLIIDPRISKRLRNKDIKRLPVPLILAFIRERGNVIDYEIPIKGNLNNPKFRLSDVILDLLKNIFVKPPTTPYSIKVKNTETEIEQSLSLTWSMKNSSLLPVQEKFIEKIANFLDKNQEVFIAVYPQQFAEKEKEYILFYEAKKKYFLAINNKSTQSFSNEDEETVAKMSVKDAAFIRYLNKRVKDPTIFNIQEKCAKLIGSDVINTQFKHLNDERAKVFISYFKEKGLEKRIKIYAGKNVIPYNGFSFYKIAYQGELPKSLMKAYQQMNELNDKFPREKFKKERKEMQEKTLIKTKLNKG